MKKQWIHLICMLLAVCMLAACGAPASSSAQEKDYVAGHYQCAQQRRKRE